MRPPWQLAQATAAWPRMSATPGWPFAHHREPLRRELARGESPLRRGSSCTHPSLCPDADPCGTPSSPRSACPRSGAACRGSPRTRPPRACRAVGSGCSEWSKSGTAKFCSPWQLWQALPSRPLCGSSWQLPHSRERPRKVWVPVGVLRVWQSRQSARACAPRRTKAGRRVVEAIPVAARPADLRRVLPVVIHVAVAAAVLPRKARAVQSALLLDALADVLVAGQAQLGDHALAALVAAPAVLVALERAVHAAERPGREQLRACGRGRDQQRGREQAADKPQEDDEMRSRHDMLPAPRYCDQIQR